MTTRVFQVDAFADRPFAGNPAAVCLLDGPAEAGWMQAVAREMNLSETAFVYREGEGFNLRWFTPAVEVELCGHATLATAHVLWEVGILDAAAEARFATRSGLLTARRAGDDIEMDFPATRETPAEAPEGLAEALGARPVYVGRSAFDLLAVLPDEAGVRALEPQIDRLRAIPARGVIVTAAATTPGLDFVSRFFAPAVGIAEDPVTGSAHCCLGPYWRTQTGRDSFVAYQASPRGGTVHVRVGDGRVVLGGHAVTVLRGELDV